MRDSSHVQHFKNLKNHILLSELQAVEDICKQKIEIPPDKVHNLDQYTNKLTKIKEIIENLGEDCFYSEHNYTFLKELQEAIIEIKNKLKLITPNATITNPNEANDIVNPLLEKATAFKETLQHTQSQLEEFNGIKKDIEKKIFSFKINPNHAEKKLAVTDLQYALEKIENEIKEGRIKNLKSETHLILVQKLQQVVIEAKAVREQSFFSRLLRLKSTVAKNASRLIKKLNHQIPAIPIVGDIADSIYANKIDEIKLYEDVGTAMKQKDQGVYLLIRHSDTNKHVLLIEHFTKSENGEVMHSQHPLQFIFSSQSQRWIRTDNLGTTQMALIQSNAISFLKEKTWLKEHKTKVYDLFDIAKKELAKDPQFATKKFFFFKNFSYSIIADKKNNKTDIFIQGSRSGPTFQAIVDHPIASTPSLNPNVKKGPKKSAP